jgi:hypoxanthine phosphoribosyltransferase
MEWKGFDKEIRELARRIDFSPDAVVGIVRGGVLPATVLANLLKVRDLRVIKVKHVGSGRRVDDDAMQGVAGMKILLVEDMLNTGKSLAAAKQYLEKKGAEVKTACLYTLPHSEMEPDFFLKQVPEIVEFPWE